MNLSGTRQGQASSQRGDFICSLRFVLSGNIADACFLKNMFKY